MTPSDLNTLKRRSRAYNLEVLEASTSDMTKAVF